MNSAESCITDYEAWLRRLADKGGKGVVDNIDARSLGRVAVELAYARNGMREWQTLAGGLLNDCHAALKTVERLKNMLREVRPFLCDWQAAEIVLSRLDAVLKDK